MALKHFYAKVYKKDSNKFGGQGMLAGSQEIITGITYKVLARGANTAETLQSDSGGAPSGTSMTNPVTTTVFETLDRIDFWCDPTDVTYDRYVDLLVVDTEGGYTAFIEDFDSYTHAVIIDETPNMMHHGCIWFSFTNAVLVDTGINFIPKTMVHDVRVEVVTADSGVTLAVGTNDTVAGFRTGVSMTATGFIKDTGVITGGSSLDYVPASTYGSLLYTAITGSDSVTAGGGRSYLGHIVDTSGTDDDLTYTPSAGSDTSAGFIHLWFTRMR
jgi:hypothetical protein